MPTETATRDHALAKLAAFRPRMGREYARLRNYDFGPDRHEYVSGLSPFLRRRIVTEAEVVAAALRSHGFQASEKFVQEVFWRTYFKGWLEQHPEVWTSYTDGLRRDLIQLSEDHELAARVEQAEAGATSLAFFDEWVKELIETGYLHNHARMWFASIWIFTLRLPWRIGADFFYRHLLDGDPASNTLGWRWVAGLHTRGKAYAAKASNIAKYTDQRFTPGNGELEADVSGLQSDEPDGLPPATPVREIRVPASGKRSLLLITEEDCSVQDFDLTAIELGGVATLSASHLRSPRSVSAHVVRFEAEALVDAAARIGHTDEAIKADQTSDLVIAAQRVNAEQIVTPYVPVGPLSDWLHGAISDFDAAGLVPTELRRDWDSAIWPHATHGFFKVKAKIPKLLQDVGVP